MYNVLSQHHRLEYTNEHFYCEVYIFCNLEISLLAFFFLLPPSLIVEIITQNKKLLRDLNIQLVKLK